jgi:hypothetical protein
VHGDAGHARVIHLVNELLLRIQHHHAGNEARQVCHQQQPNDSHGARVEAGGELRAGHVQAK